MISNEIELKGRLYLKSTQDGGRSSLIESGYRPMFDVGGKLFSGSVELISDPMLPGESRYVTVRFVYNRFLFDRLRNQDISEINFFETPSKVLGNFLVTEIVGLDLCMDKNKNMKIICIQNDIENVTRNKEYELLGIGANPDGVTHQWSKEWILIENDLGEHQWYDTNPYGIIHFLPTTDIIVEYIGEPSSGLTVGKEYQLLDRDSNDEYYYFINDVGSFDGIRRINYMGGEPNFKLKTIGGQSVLPNEIQEKGELYLKAQSEFESEVVKWLKPLLDKIDTVDTIEELNEILTDYYLITSSDLRKISIVCDKFITLVNKKANSINLLDSLNIE